MTIDDRDPQPGDFDEELVSIDPRHVEVAERSSERAVSIQVIVRGNEAVSLERIAQARGQEAGHVVAALIREAAHRAA
jgi:hypothetical protein